MLCIIGGLAVSVAQNVTISPMGDVSRIEGGYLNITCTDGNAAGSAFFLRENGSLLTGGNIPSNEVSGTTRIFYIPVNRNLDGDIYDCESVLTARVSPVITLNVSCKLNYADMSQTDLFFDIR